MSEPHPGGYRAEAARILRSTPEVRHSVTAAALSFDARRRASYAPVDVEAWRDWAREVKCHVLDRLDEHLLRAEARLVENGARVHWAGSAADAHRVLDDLVRRHGVRSVVKAKSMLSEELGVNAHLEDRGVRVHETDLGEYIIQLLGEPPSHIVGPAIHRSLEDCRRLFHRELGTPPDASPEALAAAARRVLRERFLSAEMGISGGNFLVAETGTLALIENEGNIRLTTSLPRIHVALVGIEKILPRFTDLAGFLQLTARAATGWPVGTYVSLLHGPRRPGEPDGPEEVHVILVDNGRTRLLAEERAREALRCVRCGACLNACPVYRQTGGHPYGWVYSGPIGAVLAPAFLGLEEAMPLPWASSLCGACDEVCPVRIPLSELLLHWRERAVEAGLAPAAERAAVLAWTAAATHPGLFRAAARMVPLLPRTARGRALPVLGGWLAERDLPEEEP